MSLIAVAVPVPGLGALTYGVPDGLAVPPVGARVLVPLGRRTVTGCVLGSVSRQEISRQGATEPGGISRQGAKEPKGISRQGATEPDGISRQGATEPEVSRQGAKEPRRISREDNSPGDVDGGQPVRDIVDVIDSEAFLPESVVALATWIAEYYACGVGEAIASAMPPRAWIESERRARITALGEARLLIERGLRRDVLERLAGGKVQSVEALARRSRGVHAALVSLERDGLVEVMRPLKGAGDASRTVRVVHATAQGHDEEAANAIRLGGRQRHALALLRAAPDGVAATALVGHGVAAGSIAGLVRAGLARVERRRIERDPVDSATLITAADPLDLTAEQANALERLAALAERRTFEAALLHGVTGSGKTELYLRLARRVREAGRNVLVLVPEIALTPAIAGAFRAAFADRVAIQHSALSEGERHDQWQRIRRGDVDVVVGTRSAVFAPLPRLGLVIVDEEHDGSYKQQESPRYHGRDVAVFRARAEGALVVLGSATPSMESYANARSGRYAMVTLQRRVLDRPMAEVRIVDMRAEYAAEGPDVVLSGALREALAARLGRGEQAIVLLNRRGYATAVFCRQCGATLECPNCSVSLTVHRAANRARCHYCNYSRPVPNACAQCAGPYLEQMGFGTERVEAELAEAFPDARVGRVDRDTVRRRGAIAGLLAQFARGDLDVLVGTQMIAKGHDFPRVTLVGVISADVGLGLADFRAAERTFQLLTQVAGRAGRGDVSGEAIVQTLYPNHYSIRHASRQDYVAFYEDELQYRRAMRYPPAVALVNLVVRARTAAGALDDARQIALALTSTGDPRYRVLGPAPAPLGRLKGEHRAQIFMKSTHRTVMRKALQAVLAARPDLQRRTIVDVDPMTVL